MSARAATLTPRTSIVRVHRRTAKIVAWLHEERKSCMVASNMSQPLETDYLVIGSGIAGLNFALLAAEHGRVVVITKKAPDDTNTNWAQGGVAAVLSSRDSFEQHIEDTLVAGDGLCDRDVVEMCVTAGPAEVERLLALGVRLARGPDGALDLGREGAH